MAKRDLISRIAERGLKKLTEEQRLEVVKRIAWFWGMKRILDFIKEDYGIMVTPVVIYQYKQEEKWKPVIEKFRNEYIHTLSDVPLFHKKKRLEELQEMFESFKEQGDLYKAMLVLREFRDECEAKKSDLYLTSVTYNEYRNMSNEELDEEYLRLLEQKKRLQITEDKNEDRKD